MMIKSSENENLQNLARLDFLDLCLLGETGTGKTHTARLIHEISPRREKPFVAVNCAELSPSIIEAELFGYEKGAFTGAISPKTGKFEAATGGTLFLDEIGELNSDMQAKLLKVTEEKSITRIGSNVPRQINLRIIYATNRDLRVIREDLRYRIAAHTITLKPLRQRPDEIVPLAQRFIKNFCHQSGEKITVAENNLALLEQFNWLGNVRELRSFIEKVCSDALLHAEKLQEGGEVKLLPEITLEILLSRLQDYEVFDLNNRKVSKIVDKADLKVDDFRQEFKGFESHLKLDNFQQEVKNFESYLIIGFLLKNKRNVSHTAAEMGLSRYGLIKKIKRFGINPKTC